jgi:hypothetical protein
MVLKFERQVAEFEVRVAVMNDFTALGIPVIKVARWSRPDKGEVQRSADLCSRDVKV